MSGAIFVLAINITITLTMTAAFSALAWFDRTNRPARWLGLAFLCASLSFACEYVLAAGHFELAAYMMAALLMLLALVLVAHATALRYRVRLHWMVLAAIFSASGLLYWITFGLPHDGITRMVFYQLPYAVVSLLSGWVILQARRKGLFEWSFAAAFVFLAVHFMSKPLLAELTGGAGRQARDYASTLYAAISQSSGGILLLLLAMSALAIMIKDSAAALIHRSEHDRETGLLNQNGFENRAARLLRASASASGCPASYALTLFAITGVPSGRDPAETARVAGLVLLDHGGAGILAGRMAPLDFALFEEDADLFGARAHAETVRSALADALEREFGPQINVSAGVTEREPADSWADMLARALWALEEARRAGGNCVRLAARSGIAVSRIS